MGGFDELTPQIIWTRNLLKSQEIATNKLIVYQENYIQQNPGGSGSHGRSIIQDHHGDNISSWRGIWGTIVWGVSYAYDDRLDGIGGGNIIALGTSDGDGSCDDMV